MGLQTIRTGYIFWVTLLSISLFGCNWRQNSSDNQTTDQQKTEQQSRAEREEQIRREAAKAAEKAKPAIQDAARELGKAAREAGRDVEAAAKGVREGWTQGGQSTVNVNEATEGELRALPGISHQDARKIMDARPYRNKNELVSKGALSPDRYERIRDRITV
jgi:DNA uptake protein ComE-like DNA-binding protein